MRLNITSRIAVSTFVVAWSLGASAARADEKYYMMVFAYQGDPNTPRAAHTFATFIKVSYASGADPRHGKVERHTISWLPATLDVRLLRRPQAGRNLGLRATLQLAEAEGAAISTWGPYRIKKSLYDRALSQIERLNRGEVAYKALDRAYRPNAATNCFHAVSDIVPGPLLDTGTAYGSAASAMVVAHFAPWIINPEKTSPWVIDRLGLEKEAITFEK
jgi:hypothetical protein